MKKEKIKKTYIGGQAVMEGLMLKGKTAYATAVRDPDGNVQIESKRITPPEKRSKLSRFPIIRGVINFVESLVLGFKVLMRSADVAAEEEETPSKVEKWLAEKHKVSITSVIEFFSVVLAIVFAFAIFFLAPQLLTKAISRWVGWGESPKGLDLLWFNLVEGGVRMAIFIAYITLITISKTLRRTYMYHGAEHKTIRCYEAGLPLTVDNVRPQTRLHPRCGTSFLLVVMVISILVFSVASSALLTAVPALEAIRGTLGYRLLMVVFKLALLPIVVGITYEINRWCGRKDNALTRALSAPGMWIQNFTTYEPDDAMIEVAIAAVQAVLPEEEGADRW